MKSKLIALSNVLMIALVLIGCGSSEQAVQPPSEAVPTMFLEAFFTSDLDGRCAHIIEISDEFDPNNTDPEKYNEAVQSAYTKAYEPFELLTTEDLLEKMQKNREPIKYDLLLHEREIKMIPTKIDLTESPDDKSMIHFLVTVQYSGSMEDTGLATGTLWIDETGKISRFQLDNIENLLK